jgi:hypothetical protein
MVPLPPARVPAEETRRAFFFPIPGLLVVLIFDFFGCGDFTTPVVRRRVDNPPAGNRGGSSFS